MSAPDILAALTPVAEVLERLGVRYHVGGSLASSVRGVARATLDVDLVADLELRHVAPLVAALADAYYIDAAAVQRAVESRSSFNAIHLGSVVKVDVFVMKRTELDRLAMERALPDTLEEGASRPFPVATAEDTILKKLEWFRLGGESSLQQWNDVLGVLRVGDEALDRAYLVRWAETLGVADLLARALEDAGAAG